MAQPRAIFFGTPEFAVSSLRALAECAQVVQVITQPDRPSGRGMKLTPPPVKRLAQELGLDVQQPRRVRTAAFAEQLRGLDADVGVVVAYGRILPLAVLEAPRLGCINVHGSLLPKYRGAAPIQWAITRGEAQSGVSLMQMDEGMDTGPELARKVLDIAPDETGGELAERLAAAGAELLRHSLPRLLAGELPAVPQDEAGASMAPILTKQDGRVRWEDSAQQVHDRVRGMSPWPGAFSFLDGRRVKLHKTSVSEGSAQGRAGRVILKDKHGIQVACGGGGSIAITELQPEGKRRMTAADFLAGVRLPDDARFTNEQEETT